MIIGAGFNPIFCEDGYSLPGCVSYSEAGIEQFNDSSNKGILAWNMKDGVSLHIARSPICEEVGAQDQFISFLKRFCAGKDIVSLGFHLTGPRRSGIGKFGFSSQYECDCLFEERSVRFLKRVANEVQAPVWVENTNFYSFSVDKTKNFYDSLNRISAAADAKIILDVTHLIIDALNSGACPTALLGFIDWALVAQVHLAGIVKGKDGILHDGHGEPISEDVWSFLDKCFALNLVSHDAIVTIEHTDPSWRNRWQELLADFEILEKKIDGRDKMGSRPTDPIQYARSRMKRILEKSFDDLRGSFQEASLDLEVILDAWIEDRLCTGRDVFVLEKTESTLHPDGVRARYIVDDFLLYVSKMGL